MNPSDSQGTQCVHQDFLRVVDTKNIPAERIHVRILGHTGRILGPYLRDKSRHSSYVAITQLENLMSQSNFLTDKIKEFRTFKLIFFAPDGSNLSLLIRLCSRSLYVNLSASPLLII
jgi:hypothetical protein